MGASQLESLLEHAEGRGRAEGLELGRSGTGGGREETERATLRELGEPPNPAPAVVDVREAEREAREARSIAHPTITPFAFVS